MPLEPGIAMEPFESSARCRAKTTKRTGILVAVAIAVVAVTLSSSFNVAISTALARSDGGASPPAPFTAGNDPTPTILLTPSQGAVGALVSVSGSGFPGGYTGSVYFGADATPVCSFLEDGTGSFGCSFAVPLTPGGAYTVDAVDENASSATSTFTVIPSLTLSPSSGPSGVTVTASGSGFASTDTSVILSDSTEGNLNTCTVVSGSISGTCTFVANVANGFAFSGGAGSPTTVTATGTPAYDTATATFTGTVATLTLSPGSAPNGVTVTATASGFASTDGSIGVTSPTSATICSISTGGSGGGACTFVPTSGNGFLFSSGGTSNTVTATGAAANDAAVATFTGTVTTLSLSPSSGPSGVTVTATGSGFASTDTSVTLWDSADENLNTCAIVSGSISGTCTFFANAANGFAFSGGAGSPTTVTATASPADDAATATFDGTVPSITLAETSGPTAATVTIAGSGFDSSDTTLTVSGGAVASYACAVSNQTITSCSFVVGGGLGPSTVTVTGSGGPNDSTTASFTVTTPSITLLQTSGPAGATVTITGGGFFSSDTTLSVSGGAVASYGCSASDQTVTTCSFVVGGGPGESTVTVTGSGGPNDHATASFTVTTPSISLLETSGPDGATVTITGGGFLSSDTTLTVSGGAVSSYACTASDQTITSCSFVVGGGPGVFTVTVAGTGGPSDRATGSFLVTTPSITLLETSGPDGATATITGGGFFSSDTALAVSSKPSGAVASYTCAASDQTITSCSFVVGGTTGSYTISVKGNGGPNDVGSAPFLVTTPVLTLTPATGPNGALESASGTGFTPYVSITFGISSGGLISSASPCSVSASQAFSGCTFTVTGTPATSYSITATGSDGSFDSATASFKVTSLAPPTGGTQFAKLPLPVGVAVNSTGLLATEFNDCTTIFSISSTGTVTTFATAPDLDAACEAAYPAVSPGFAFFAKGEVFLTQGPYVFEVGPKGGSMSLFTTVSAFGTNPNQPTGITFDTVGTFGFQMVLSGGPTGTILTVSSTAGQTVVGSVGYPVEGPAVAPLTFGAYAGDVLVGTGAANTMAAVTPAGGVTTVTSWPGAWSVSTVPATTCSFDGTDSYFVADESAGAVYAFPSSDFTSLAGDALVTSDSPTNPSGVAEVSPTGAAASFSASTDLLPGSMYAFCPVFGVEAVIPSIGIDPYEMAYDPANGLMYSSDHASDLVYLFNSASTIVGTVKVGTDPSGIAYDPANNEMLVANSGSNSVTYVNARTNSPIGSVSVGKNPQGLAYDLYNFEMYVGNEGSNSVSLISPFNTVVATLSTGSEPFGVAFNPLPLFIGTIYTANMGGTLTVITGLKTTTISLPCAAANIAEDFVNGEMYVDDYACSEVSLVLGTKIVTTLNVGPDPFGVAFDSKTGFMYVSNTGAGTLTVLNGTKTALTVYLGFVPYGAGVTYDPANNLVYVAGGDPRPTSGGDT